MRVVSASMDFAAGDKRPGDPRLARAAAEPQWRKINTWTGSGNKETESFETQGPEWRIVWKFDKGQLPADGLLQIYAHDAGGKHVVSLATNVVAESKADVSYVRTPPGRYYLRINAIGNWSATAEDRRNAFQ
jgi:hypothetical protein